MTPVRMRRTAARWCPVAALLTCQLLSSTSGRGEEAEFIRPEYQVLRTADTITIDGKLDEASWENAPAIGGFQFPWWKEGDKEQTVAKLLWDDRQLYVGCVCTDRHITARTRERDGPVYQDDCFEIMLAPRPDRPEVYFNLEWNVLGGILDNFRPRGPQQPRAPKWDAADLQVGGTYVGTLNTDTDVDEHWIVEVAIPFANFADYSAQTPPQSGSAWHMNLNRHGGETNPQYSQWSAGDTPAPSFHTPHRFGRILFSAEIAMAGRTRRDESGRR